MLYMENLWTVLKPDLTGSGIINILFMIYTEPEAEVLVNTI